MKLVRVSRDMSIDDLVRIIEHANLRTCCDAHDFRQELLVIIRNCDRLLEFLGGASPETLQAQRIAKRIKSQSLRLREFCAKILSSLDDSNWRELAARVAQDYEKLRMDAGQLYRASVPNARFGVLGVAL